MPASIVISVLASHQLANNTKELTQEKSRIRASIVKSASTLHQLAGNANELTGTGIKPYTCKHCDKCFSQLSHCKAEYERTHTGVKPSVYMQAR